MEQAYWVLGRIYCQQFALHRISGIDSKNKIQYINHIEEEIENAHILMLKKC